MGKNVHYINYANSIQLHIWCHTIIWLWKNEATAKISKSDKREKKCIVEKTVVYGSQNTVKRMSKYVAKKVNYGQINLCTFKCQKTAKKSLTKSS